MLSIYLNMYDGNRFTTRKSRIDNSNSHQDLLLLLPLRHQVLAAVVEAAVALAAVVEAAVALAEGVVEAEEVDSNQTERWREKHKESS